MPTRLTQAELFAIEFVRRESARAELRREFNRQFVDRYECQWVTIGAHGPAGDREGGSKVCIGDSGKIEKGPKALTGRSIKRLMGPSLKSKRKQSLKEIAKRYEVDADELEEMAAQVYEEERELSKEREAAKKLARDMTGLTERDVSRIENSGRDYSTVKGFDEAADEIASNYPGILDRSDPEEALWQLLREGKQDLPTQHDTKILELAAERILAGGNDDTSFDFGNSPDNDRFSRLRSMLQREFYRRGL